MKSKVCAYCKLELPASDFRVRSDGRTLESYCKPCHREAVRRSRAKNPERTRRRRRAELEANRERARELHRAWYEKNRDRVARQVKRWREENAEKANASFDTQRRRKRDALVEEIDREGLFARDRGRCGICGETVDPDDWWIDYIQPLAGGGSIEHSNAQVSHPVCNMKKYARAEDGGRFPQ